MTSTNDGKDVNCKQSSGPKGKLYFIELYKFLDSRLSGEESLQERTQHICQAWQCIHSLCLHSSPKLHLHLLGWLQTHTAQTILHTEWQKPELLPQHGNLAEAIDVHINECKDAIAKRKGSSLFWEIHLLKRAEWFKKVLSNPWGHPILKRLSNPTEEKPSDREVIEWLKEERSEMFVSRLRQLAMSKACVDIAASLATAVMDRARASAVAHEQEKDKSDKNEPTFADTLSREAGFNSEVWDLLTDLEFVLLFQGDNASRCIELAKQRSLRSGYKLVERLLGHADKLPRDKKLWKNAKKVAKLIAQVTITRCMVLPSCAGVVYDALYHCARSLAALLPAAALPRAVSALAAPAATAAHLHTLAAAVSDKCKDEMKAFVCELYVRAITTGMNELERLKLKTEKASEARSTEQMLCTWFTQLGTLLANSPRLNYECALTAFSVHPSPAMYERIVAAPALPPLITNTDTHEASGDTNSEFGSWATDSRTTTNFVKTSETLNIKQIQNNANVLSTAVLTEGEAIGLGTDLCQDLAVLLSGPRHKILSWDINRDVLLENCKTYMERTDGGTRALTTELKYLNLDPRSFQHLPFEKDDEDNIYYGIEKGYEHLVEHEEVEVDKQWHEVLFQSETEDAISSCMDDTDSPVRRKKKKSKRLVSTDQEVDPLSLSDDQQHQKKKERPHSKERLKLKTKSSSKNKEQKGERKERKKKDKINTASEPSVPLSSLVGMTVTRVDNATVKQEKQIEEQNLNRKLSITSLNSDSGDNNVVFDGLYSMDDIYSPEKSNRSLQALTNKTIKSNTDLDDDNKPLSQVNYKASLNNKDKETELRINSVITSQQQNAVPDNGPSINTNYKEIPAQQDNTVKQNLKKLIEVRRLKSDSNLQLNTTSQLQSSDNSSHTQSHSIVSPPKTLQEDIKDPCSVPLNTSSSLYQSSMNNVNLKQFDHISPSTSEVRSILNGNSGASDTSGKLYVGRIVFGLAKYTSSLNEQKLKESDTQSKPKPAPVAKVESKNIKIHNKRPPDKEKRIAQKQVLVRNQPQHDKPKNINEIKTEYNNFGNKNDKLNIKNETITSYNNLVNELQPQQGDKVKNTNETKSIYRNLINELQPQQRCDKLKSTTGTKNNYKNFVDELKATINAGAVDDEFYKESVIQKDRAVPSSKTSSIPNQSKLKIQSASTPQCAKSVIHQKITEAPNTFARLNYMHKNKQSHVRIKPTSGNKQIQEKVLVSELDKQISDYKLDKFHYLQTKDLTISRVGTGIHNRQPNDTPMVMQKREVRAPFVLQTRNTPHVTKDQSGISNVIKPNEKKIPLKIKTDATDETTSISSNKYPTYEEIIETTKSSMLMEKDQQDLLLLLRQKNKLNAQNPVITTPELKFKHVAQISPQCKTESRSLNLNVISNTRDLDGADFRRLTDYNNKNILHESTNSSNKTFIPPSDQTHPSVIKMTSGSKAIIHSSQLLRKSEEVGSGPGSINDVYSGSKNPVKKERHTQKKNSEIHLDIETKSDWKLVMQDLLKHKTPSRGPNALDVALNKDSFTKHTTKNTIYDEKAVVLEAVKRNEKASENTTSHGNTDYQKVIPSDYTLRTAVSSVPMATIQPEVPKRISKPEVIQKTDMYYVPKPSLPEVPKITCDAVNNHDPFISGLPNSDYDILEELMDDDLRQEIGELISDDESLHYANVTDRKGQCSTIVTPFQKSFYDNTQRVARTQEMHTICTTALQQDHTFATTNITRNVINTNLEQFPQPSAPAINSGDRTYSNIKVAATTKMIHPNNIVHNIELPGIKGNTFSSNISPVVESRSSLHTPRSNNGVYQKRENNLDSRNVLFTTISPRASLQNVGIGSETDYDPYYTMQVQENQNSQVHNFVPNKYITVNNMPNISFLPTTFATPSVTPVVFGNTLTQTGTQNVQDTLPTSTIHPMKYSCEPNLNSASQSNKFIESTTSMDNKNKMTPKNACNIPDAKLENNKHLTFNHEKKEVKERKTLPPEQVGVKLPHTKPDHKLSSTLNPLDDIDTKIPCSIQTKRLEQKRMALINRETRHYTNRSPIPLPYMSLEKDETESVKADKCKEDSDLKVKYINDDVITPSEKNNYSKNKSLEKCKNDKDIPNVAESKERENERKNRCSEILRHNRSKPTSDPKEKHKKILNETSKIRSKKDKLKIKNPPLKVTSTLKRRVSKTKTLIRPAKIRGCKASINLNNYRSNSIEATKIQKLEENTGIRGNFEISDKILNKSDYVPAINTFSIENECFDIEEQLIGTVISKSQLTEPTKDLDISETKEMTVEINGKGEEKENDLNKSQKVIHEKQDTNNIKSDIEADETSIKNNFSEQKSNTDNASTKICNGKSVLRRLQKKRNACKNPNDEIKTFKIVASNERSTNKLSIKSPLLNNDDLHENSNETKVLSTDNICSIKQMKQTAYDEVIDLDEVPETSVPRIELTNNLVPVNNNDKLANCRLQCYRAVKKTTTHKKRCQKIYTGKMDLKQIIFQEISSKKTKNKASKAIHVILPNGIKFKAVIKGSKNCDVNNLVIDTNLKCSLLNNFFNNKITFSRKIRQKKTIGFSRTTKTLQNTNVIETIDLISDDELDSGVTAPTEIGNILSPSLDKDLAKHQNKLSSKCTVSLNRYSIEGLIALKRSIKYTKSCGIEKSIECLPPKNKVFQNIQGDESEQITKIPILCDENVLETTDLEKSSNNDNTLNEAHIGLGSEKINMEPTTDEIQNVTTALKTNEEVNDVDLISPTTAEQIQDIHGLVKRTQQNTNNFDCFIKLTRCDNLVKKIGALKCYVELVRCDGESFNNANPSPSPHLLEEETSKETNGDKREDDTGKMNDELIHPLFEDEENKYESRLERSISCSILTDFLIYKETIDTTIDKKVINVNEQEGFVGSPVYFEVACYAEWSMTKRDIFLQTAIPMEYIYQDPNFFDNSPNYAEVPTKSKGTKKVNSVPEILPTFQVQSLGKLVLKFFVSNSFSALLYPISHDTANITENSKPLLKRKLSYKYRSSRKKISKLEHQIPSCQENVITEQVKNQPCVGSDSKLNTESANDFDETEFANNSTVDENNVCIQTCNDTSLVSTRVNENAITPKCDILTFNKDTGLNIVEQVDMESNKDNKNIHDPFDDANRLNKTAPMETDVCKDDNTKLEILAKSNSYICKDNSNTSDTTKGLNEICVSSIDKPKDHCDSFHIIEDNDIPITPNNSIINQSENKLNSINVDHSYVTINKHDSDGFCHVSGTKFCGNEDDSSDLTEQECNVMINSTTEVPNITTETVQDVVLGNVENGDVTYEQGAEDKYDVLRNVTLVYQDNAKIMLRGIEYEDPIAGTCYMFPLESNTMFTDVVDEGDYFCDEKEYEYAEDDDKLQIKSNTGVDVLSDDNLSIVPPIKTYLRYENEDKLDTLSNRGIKRKNSLDHKVSKKRYRKSKNIDYLKASVDTQMNTAYGKEYKQLLHYYSSIKFSYTRPFDKEQIDVPNLLSAWPLKETHDMPLFGTESSDIFKDDSVQRCYPDPLKQTLAEELSAEVTEYPITSDDTSDTNFSMGFGEESGRVIQNLEKKDDILKFSAATLSDVKQSQPFLMSKEYVGCENSIEVSNLFSSSKKNQNIKLKTDYIQLKDKVRSYFKKTAIELKYNWIRDNLKDKDLMRNFNGDYNFTNCLLDFYLHDFIEPPPIESIVQVVQIGQLPVSAAAQNPVSCDPRVTQVANASPPQCSEENSSHDDSHSPVKTEYTELTTADLTLPLVAEYNRHDCQKITESQEPAHLHNNQEILQSEFGYCGKMDNKEDYNHDEVKDLSLKNKEFQTLGKEKPNQSVYHYDTNADTECPELDTQTTFFDSTNKETTVSERTDQIAHAMSAAGITTSIEENSKAHALVNNISEDLHQSNVDPTQNHKNNCPNTASINAVALQQALAQILPPPLRHTTSAETDSQTSSITPQVLHIVQGKNSEGNQITLVDKVQQSVISTPNAAPVLHIVQNKGSKPNASNNGASVQQTNSFGALSLVETGHQNGNQLLHIVNTGNQKDNNANQLLKTVNLLTNLANVQGSNEQKMLQFVCKSTDGKAIQLNTPHHGSMVLRLQPIETQSVQDGPSNDEQLSPTPAAASNTPVEENINTQQEIKSRSVYEENYAKFIQNASSKSNPEKGTSLPKFNQAFGKPVFQEENQKESEINSNDTHLTSVNSVDDTPETSDNVMNLDHIAQISSPPLLLRKSPQTSQAPPSLVPQIKQSVTPMNIQTMHGGVIYTRQIPVNIGGGQTINLITVPSTELIDDSNQKQQDVKFINQGDIVEPSIIKIVPQTTPNSDLSPDENHNAATLNEGAQNTQSQPVLTQMRIKLPMLSKAPQMVSGTRVVRPSFFQIQRNVIGGANQPVYQQLVLTTAPPLGQQTIRLPQSPMTRPIKVPSESSPESHLSSSTLEQLREFDMVLEQVKERSTVQPNSTANSSISKPHTTTSSDAKDGASPGPTPSEPTPVLYSVGANQQFNVAYVNRKSTVTTPTTSTVVRSPDSSVTESTTSSNHVQVSQTVTTASTSNSTSVQQSNPKPKVSSRSRPRPKASSNPPNTLKLNNVPSKPSTQKPIEDEQTTQRILYILAEYREQVENCPDKNKPAPRRRTNPPSNPGSSKRKKSSSGSRRSGGARDSSPINGDDANRTMGSEDSSCGTSQGDCNENCLETPSPQDSPRKLPRKLSFENETPPQPRPQLQRNVIVADGQTITVARGPTGKPATALLMPANYILPVSMLKGGQQIAIVTNRGPKLLTLSGEGGTTGALLLQRLIGPAGLKPMLARPGVRHVRLPAAALHNLHAFNFATATTVQPPDSTMSPASASTPPDLVETGTAASPWTEKETQSVKPERSPSPDGSEPWNVPTPANTHEYTYEETVRTDNLDRTVLDPIPDRYSPEMEAQRIFDKMFDVEAKRSYIVDTQDDSPRCGYDIDTSDCDDKCYHQVVQKRDISSHRQHRLTHVTAALRHKYAILEHELRLQKSLSEECEDLGVDSPSASELFPEAELLFAGSPAQEHTQDQHPHRPHTPPPVIINQSVPRPDMDDQIATDHLLQRPDLQEETNSDLAMNLGLDDVGIVTVTENGATITLDHEEFARSHPNTTFHKEPTEETEMHPYTVSGIKSRHITSTIFHASRAPATVLMGPQTTVISQASHDSPHIQHNLRYAHMDNVINTPAPHQHNLNLNTVLVKDDGLTRYDSILTDSRELHLSHTASAIVHSVGNATQVIRRVGYDDDKRDSRFLMDDDTLMTGDDSKMMGEDNSREALESMCGDVDYRSSPERQTELYWESNSVADHSESRRQMDFSSDSEKCCRSPPYEENNSTDSSGMSTQVRLDSVIKDARGMDRSGSADGSSADDTLPPLRTYPAKRVYHHPMDRDTGRSLSGKTRAGEGLDSLDVRRRASGRGVVKRCCHCCSGSPLPPRPKKPKPRKPYLDYHMH